MWGGTETATILASKTGITSASNTSLSIGISSYKKLRIVLCENSTAAGGTVALLNCEDVPLSGITATNTGQIITLGLVTPSAGIRLYVNLNSNKNTITGTQYFMVGTPTYPYEYYIYGIK